MILFDDRDYEPVITQAQWNTSRNDGAGTLTVTFPAGSAPLPQPGQQVVFSRGGEGIFWGWVFRSQQDRKNAEVLCCDQLRYLKNSDTIYRPAETLDRFLNRVCAAAGDRIRLGTVEQCQTPLSPYLFDNRTRLDMLYQSIREIRQATGLVYILRDSFGGLELREVGSLLLPLTLGDGSLVTGYRYSGDLDATANQVRVLQSSASAGIIQSAWAEDTASVARFGPLTLVEKADRGMTLPQMQQQAMQLLQARRGLRRTLRLEAIGETQVRAGSSVRVVIGKLELDTWALVLSASHTFNTQGHRMTLELEWREEP